jgi:hypothetical protein
MVALIITMAKAANKKMPQQTITARRRSRRFRAADRDRADAARDGAAGAMAVFLPVDDLSAIGCALHKQGCTLPFVGKFSCTAGGRNLKHRSLRNFSGRIGEQRTRQ